MEIKINNLDKVRNHLDFAKEGPHQAILGVGYDEWNREASESNPADPGEPRHPDWGFEDMIYWVAEELGEFAALMVMLGKTNQQVLNGGWDQFFYNNYAGEEDDLLELMHKSLGDLIKVVGEHDRPVLEKMYGLVIEVEEQRGYQTEGWECPSCRHDLEEWLRDERNIDLEETVSFGFLDSRYYSFNEELMKTLNQIIGMYIEEQKEKFQAPDSIVLVNLSVQLQGCMKESYLDKREDCFVVHDRYLVQCLFCKPTTVGVVNKPIYLVTNQFTGVQVVMTMDIDLAVDTLIARLYLESDYVLVDAVKARCAESVKGAPQVVVGVLGEDQVDDLSNQPAESVGAEALASIASSEGFGRESEEGREDV